MAKPIMIQGTMSNAGKSLITAGLCRIFQQDGYKVAPFKSQNMALNSYVTKNGHEIGRAQAMQAECCKIPPDVRMNPILLKPTTDMGSQVIVNGIAYKNMTAKEYFQYKKGLIPEILNSYNSLSEENDIIVVEGAGSPAEINLKDNDIVNMGLAKLIAAPVILVGDINLGGVFASLYGTMQLLTAEEQNFVKAVIINKFRGDKEILEPGLDELYKLINKPVAGVVPYFKITLDDEDSESHSFNSKKTSIINIGVVKLPKISNFTDFAPFEIMENIGLTYIDSPHQLQNMDLIILPGTKSTVSDLLWLRNIGLEVEIKKAANKGVPIIGICGGFEMLGKTISDCYESDISKIEGMNLLDFDTIFEKDKTSAQVKGKFLEIEGIFSELSNIEFEGYEIHMGRIINSKNKFSSITSNSIDGICHKNILGSFVHGLFDNKDISNAIIKSLCKYKEVNNIDIKTIDMYDYKESQYNLLADVLRESLDMNFIYNIIGLS